MYLSRIAPVATMDVKDPNAVVEEIVSSVT